MKLIIPTAIIVALIVWYALKGRAWLKTKPWAQGFFAWIEPIEIALYKKSETILMGRLLWVGSLFVTAYDSATTFLPNLDLTPITTRIFDALHVANDFRALATSAFIAAIGLAINWLRSKVTKPLSEVAAPEPKA